MTPEDEGDVPLYIRGRRGVNLSHAFRSTVYRCACGRRFEIPHPALALIGIPIALLVLVANGIAPIHSRVRAFGQARGSFKLPTELLFVIALGIVTVLVAPQLYYRWRYPRVR